MRDVLLARLYTHLGNVLCEAMSLPGLKTKPGEDQGDNSRQETNAT